MNAQKRNVTLYYEGVSCMLRADRGMISELVENLCQNAIRYNNEGGEVHDTGFELLVVVFGFKVLPCK